MANYVQFVGELKTSFYPKSNTGLYETGDAWFYHTDGYIYGGAGNTGTLFKLNPNTLTIAAEDQVTFDPLDVSYFKQLMYHDNYLYGLIGRSGYTGNWIQKFTMDLALSGEPLYAGTVVYGTDGNIYGSKAECLNQNASWINYWRPITGQLWANGWERLPNDYPYHIGATDSYSGGVSSGATLINFGISSNGTYILNNGPVSGFLASSSFVSEFTVDGERLGVVRYNNTIGPQEMVWDTEADQFAWFRCTSASGNLRLKSMVPGTYDALYDTLITGLVDGEGDLRDNSIYHTRTIWYSNNVETTGYTPDNEPQVWDHTQEPWGAGNVIVHNPCGHWHKRRPPIAGVNLLYTMNTIYPNDGARIIAVNPDSAELVYQYAVSGGWGSGSFAALCGKVYVWQQYLDAGADHISSIITLTQELNYLGLDGCEGGYRSLNNTYYEVGRCIITDGVQYLFNFAKASTLIGGGGLITKYRIVK